MERLPGFRDFYPEPLPHSDVWSADARRHIFDRWRETARRYGFREYDGPPLEPLELYTLKSGAEIVGQLYNFEDKGQRKISLRPEMTPTLARMVAAHERSYKKPIKWFAVPQLFRYERQQKGRLREHFQFNADLIGETGPAADAELAALLIDTLRACGLTENDFVIRLSSRNFWQDCFSKHGGDKSKEYEFYQAIDKLERAGPEHTLAQLHALGMAKAQEILDLVSSNEPTAELDAVVKNLKARGLGGFVKVDYHVIRGLAYYTGVVFEAFDTKGELRAIAGGGRYDNLIKLISGGKVDLPALGFGMGDVVLLELLKERGLLPAFDAGIDACCLIEDEATREATLALAQSLRDGGCAVEYALGPAKPDKQFKRAMELKARYTIKLVPAAQGGWEARLKNLATREEKTAALADVKHCLQR
ncbi:MAG TPA: histidine--tRNA ligase [Verrucomicrobiae bacterium]|jgi:histidyl-tRNA synthetase